MSNNQFPLFNKVNNPKKFLQKSDQLKDNLLNNNINNNNTNFNQENLSIKKDEKNISKETNRNPIEQKKYEIELNIIMKKKPNNISRETLKIIFINSIEKQYFLTIQITNVKDPLFLLFLKLN